MIPALITAGATRNPVDAIRYLSAGATGSKSVDECAMAIVESLAAKGIITL